ncbi:ribonuclease HII [Proteiniborus sp. DW1]|uniref:ribonuclease HII n=1 Tax=Proteiniborus sp. DW1 TaxID=1889883 RepID=UPI00092E165E|nr:ribonuclease HII [Proteiniborus sp. DW1]SCG83468.1 ribonuclease HII [Proteiniborus sp. DW1]
MLELEQELWNKGYKNIACIDEVGRGCLAGDVVACAIILPIDLLIEGVKDSKKLSPKKRESLYEQIYKSAVAVGIGSVDSKTIDKINIKNSTIIAMEKALEALKDGYGNHVNPDYILVDAEKLTIDIPQMSIIKGDEKCHGIAAASIVAKVYRDRKCEEEWAHMYPEYGFEKHKGYGTKAHIEAIKKYGPCPIHRDSFLTKIISKKDDLQRGD